MDYPVIDPVRTGSNIKMLIRDSGNRIAGVGRMLGIADMSTMYKWLREYELRAKKPPSWKGTRQKKTVNVPFCVRQILTGGNLTEIARESGVSTSTIYYRIKQAGYNLDELKELYQANHGQHKNCIYSSKTMKSCKYGGECCYYLVVTGKRRPCPADDCFVYEKGSRRNERKRKLY